MNHNFSSSSITEFCNVLWLLYKQVKLQPWCLQMHTRMIHTENTLLFLAHLKFRRQNTETTSTITTTITTTTSRLSFSKFKTSLVFFLGISRLKIPPLTTAIFQISYNDRAKSKGKSRRSRSAFMTVKEVGGTTKEQEWWSFESLALALDWTKQSWSLK